MMVAFGPFSTTQGTFGQNYFSPFDQLLKKVEENKPQILILGGPFVDSRQPELSENEQMTYEEIFEKYFVSPLQTHSKKNKYKVIILPSFHDNTNFPFLPQPPFDRNNSKSNLVYLPNPSVFSVNEQFTVGFINADIIPELNLSFFESKSLPENTDRISRMSSCFFEQQSFLPFDSPNFKFDSDHLEQLGFPSFSPDILIVPSEKYLTFANKVSNSLVVNPGNIIKQKTVPGSYSIITVFQPSEENLNSTIPERTKVEFIRI